MNDYFIDFQARRVRIMNGEDVDLVFPLHIVYAESLDAHIINPHFDKSIFFASEKVMEIVAQFSFIGMEFENIRDYNKRLSEFYEDKRTQVLQ